MLKHLDAILIVAGQASVILSVQLEELWLIPAGMALAATGLGLRSRSVGRRVVSWVLVGIFFPLLVSLVGLAFMTIKGKRCFAEFTDLHKKAGTIVTLTVS